MRFYTVVYGNEWEDIAYFTDFDKAQIKLVIQTVCDEPEVHFHPIMYEYNEFEGVMYRSKHHWYLNHITLKDSDLTYDEVVAVPRAAFEHIKVST